MLAYIMLAKVFLQLWIMLRRMLLLHHLLTPDPFSIELALLDYIEICNVL